MKHAIATITLVLVSTAAHGGQLEDTCGEASRLAETMAEAHYTGVPMRDVMNAVQSDIGRAVAREAYKLPDYTTKEYQNRTIRQFGNDVYSQCHERFSEG